MFSVRPSKLETVKLQEQIQSTAVAIWQIDGENYNLPLAGGKL